ncbi:MAG: MauE/DoxX family redox-associated membrane protein [Cellvibrionaceae bacterium]
MPRQTAQLYRMVTEKHICPFGLKAKYLLTQKGLKIEEHLLTSREAADNFKKEHDVNTTPQVFINEERVGGYEALRKHFGLPVANKNQVTYMPVIAIFVIAFLMSVALQFQWQNQFSTIKTLEWFVAISMCLLAVQKFRDLTAFTNQFITYDLLAMRTIPYAYVYPFAEAYAGIGMLAGFSYWLVAPVSLFIGTIGAASVIKAVYIDQRELKCACVGGNSQVPLGFISLTENLMMIGMGTWMFIR